MKITGKARDDREVFEFTIAPFVGGGFLLSIHFHGDGRSNHVGAGVWPTVEKAKGIAQQAAAKLLHVAQVQWQDH